MSFCYQRRNVNGMYMLKNNLLDRKLIVNRSLFFIFVFLTIMSSQIFSFSFSNPCECVRVYLKDGPCLLLQNESIATARVSFIKEGEGVNIPEGLVIVDTTEGTTVSPCSPSHSHFILEFTCSYEIMWEGGKVLSLIQSQALDPDILLLPAEQRKWNVCIEDMDMVNARSVYLFLKEKNEKLKKRFEKIENEQKELEKIRELKIENDKLLGDCLQEENNLKCIKRQIYNWKREMDMEMIKQPINGAVNHM